MDVDFKNFKPARGWPEELKLADKDQCQEIFNFFLDFATINVCIF